MTETKRKKPERQLGDCSAESQGEVSFRWDRGNIFWEGGDSITSHASWSHNVLCGFKPCTCVQTKVVQTNPVLWGSYKHVSKRLYTSYSRCTFGPNSVHTSPRAYRVLVFIKLSSTNLFCLISGSKTPQGLWIMHRLLRPVRVRLRCKHAGVIWLPITLSGCVSSILRNLTKYNFSPDWSPVSAKLTQ